MLLSPILPQRFQLPESQQDPKVSRSPLPPPNTTANTHTQSTASPQPLLPALLNFAIVALMVAVIWARVRAKDYKLSALEWDDCKFHSWTIGTQFLAWMNGWLIEGSFLPDASILAVVSYRCMKAIDV